jgi:hypothetical protein
MATQDHTAGGDEITPVPLTLTPIPLKDRAAMIFVEYAQLDVDDGCFVAIDAEGTRTIIPVCGIA